MRVLHALDAPLRQGGQLDLRRRGRGRADDGGRDGGGTAQLRSGVAIDASSDQPGSHRLARPRPDAQVPCRPATGNVASRPWLQDGAMRVLDRSVYRGPHVHGGDADGPLRARPRRARAAPDRHDSPASPTACSRCCPASACTAAAAATPAGSSSGCTRAPGSGTSSSTSRSSCRSTREPRSRAERRARSAGGPVSTTCSTRTRSEAVGLHAGRLALELVAGLLPPELAGVAGLELPRADAAARARTRPVPGLAALRRLAATQRLGPTTPQPGRRGAPPRDPRRPARRAQPRAPRVGQPPAAAARQRDRRDLAPRDPHRRRQARDQAGARGGRHPGSARRRGGHGRRGGGVRP